MANDREGYSIIPPSAVYGENWPLSGVIPQGLYGALSVAGWTSGNEGFQQQTFLGASIRSFSVSAGFGDTSSTMGIELVNDEYNNSEGSGFDLEYAGLKNFFGGLEAVVGAPNPNVLSGMRREHCNEVDSIEPFITPNYKMQTTTRIEWWFVERSSR